MDRPPALGEYVKDQGFRVRTDAPRRLSVIRAGAAAGYDDLLAGVREGLRGTGVTIDLVDDPDQAAFRRATRSDRVVSSIISGDRDRLSTLIAGLGEETSSQILTSGALFDERLIIDSGAAGLQGTISSPGAVRINSRDGEAYATVVPLLFSGERPSIAGLQGYTAGLALDEAFRDGSDPEDVHARLDRPRAFTDAITGPWLRTARTRGAPFFTIVQPQFLPENLIPAGTGITGATAVTGKYFPGGSWSPLEGAVYGARIPGGPVLGAAETPLSGGAGAVPGPPGGTPIPGTGGVKAP